MILIRNKKLKICIIILFFLGFIFASKYFLIRPAIERIKTQTPVLLETLIIANTNEWKWDYSHLQSTNKPYFFIGNGDSFLNLDRRDKEALVTGRTGAEPHLGEYRFLKINLMIQFDDKELRNDDGLLNKKALLEKAKKYISDGEALQKILTLRSDYNLVVYNTELLVDDMQIERSLGFSFQDPYPFGILSITWAFPIDSLPQDLKKSFGVLNSNIFNFGLNFINSFVIAEEGALRDLNAVRFYAPVWFLEGVLYNRWNLYTLIWVFFYGIFFYFLFWKLFCRKIQNATFKIASIVGWHVGIQSLVLFIVFFLTLMWGE